ncbi:hypothetical protein F4677DRAFT_404690 [Hypoxylon crocopeplum]|nr:hypothetical protein F4677DRAFT_404690 [Hypoxylon crocopeplum]
MSILSQADIESLLGSGLVSPSSPNGTRRIHKRRLNRSSDEENSHLPLSPVSMASSASTSNMFSTIPEVLISLATLKHLGCNEETATRLWGEWTNWPSGNPVRETDDEISGVPFIEFVTGHLASDRNIDTFDENNQEWYDCMNHCGTNPEVQASIMDPIFRDIRLTESCLFWIKDTVDLRYRGLVEVQKASRDRTMTLQRASSRPVGSGSGGHGGSSMGPSSTYTTTVGVSGGQHSISGTMGMAPGISRDTAMSQIAVSAAENSPGYTTLYKGLDQARLNGVFDDDGNVVNIGKLLSTPPTDFLSRDSGFYFAVNRDVAEYYACYAKRRDDVSSVAIVHITIRNSAIENLSATQLQKTYWPNTEWKNLVFHCRRRLRLPAELRKFKDACLIIGTIAKKPNSVYNTMDSAQQITEAMVLKTSEGCNAVQYVFHNDEGEEFLEEHATPGLKVFPLTAQEFAVWHGEHMRDLPESVEATG